MNASITARSAMALFCAVFFIVSTGTACSNATEDEGSTTSTSTFAIEECTPEEPYTDCIEIDLENLEYWQDTAQEPDWRVIEEYDGPGDISKRIILNVEKLNGGVLPTKEGQGYYDSEDHYREVLSQLLGVTLNDDVTVVTTGYTAKVTQDGEVTDATHGDFIFDALSNDEGKVFIDGVDETENALPGGGPHEFEIVEDDGEDTTTTSTLTNAAIETIGAASGWSARHAAVRNSGGITKWSGSEVHSIKRDGTACRFVWWNFWTFFRECYKANIHLNNDYFNHNGDPIGSDGKSGYDKKILKLYWYAGWGGTTPSGVCSNPEVEFPGGHWGYGSLGGGSKEGDCGGMW